MRGFFELLALGGRERGDGPGEKAGKCTHSKAEQQVNLGRFYIKCLSDHRTRATWGCAGEDADAELGSLAAAP